jgi:hypothetical protein
MQTPHKLPKSSLGLSLKITPSGTIYKILPLCPRHRGLSARSLLQKSVQVFLPMASSMKKWFRKAERERDIFDPFVCGWLALVIALTNTLSAASRISPQTDILNDSSDSSAPVLSRRHNCPVDLGYTEI